MDGLGYVGRTKWRVRIRLQPGDVPMLLKMAINRHIAKMLLSYLAKKLGLKRAKTQVDKTPVEKIPLSA